MTTAVYQVFQIEPTVAYEDFGDEVVVVDVAAGTYFSMSGATADAFKAFAAPATVALAATALSTRWDLPEGELVGALEALVVDLLAARLLVASEAAAAPVPLEPLTPRRTFGGFALERHDELQDLLAADPVQTLGAGVWPPVSR